MKLLWTRKAIRHLTAVRSYIAKDSEQSAAALVSRILTAVELLATQPELGRTGRIPGTRELIVPHTPYIIPYRVQKQSIELLAVFHAAREWPAKF
jgi:toxin ParE1/3/4